MNVLDQAITDDYALYHGDCIEVIKAIPDNTIHYSIFSPPFASLYTYSDSDRDLGNVANHAEFYAHLSFLVPDLLRVTKPGRLLSFHAMNLPTSKARDGVIGLTDFRGILINAFQEEGWIYHSEVVIWKDPVTAMQRTKALGLLHKQLKKDSCMSRQGIPDYLVTMRKPGDNPERVTHTDEDLPVSLWQRYASPVWMDINPNDTLQHESVRDHADERHICVAKGSLVLTKEGFIPIEQVEIGSMVLTHAGRWRPVVAKACNGIKPVVRTTAHGVADLRTTPDHLIYLRRSTGPGRWPGMSGGISSARRSAQKNCPDWVRADGTLGGYVNTKLPPVEDDPLTEDEWWIVGRWLGDGHRGGHAYSGVRGGVGQFFISCSHREAPTLIERLGVHAGAVHKVTATQITLRNLRPEVRDVLNRCGNGACNKRLPGEAVSLSPEKAESLLSGYLSADGHYVDRYERWCASSTSRALLLGMAMVAQRARRVVASVYAGRSARNGTIAGRSVSMAQEWIMIFRNSLGRRPSGWIGDDGAWKKVRTVTATEDVEVWDIQVEDDESFTVEGCLVHNCPLQLEVIRRGLVLWSNPGDTVLDPFAGIGSSAVVALREGRKAIAVELKPSYYRQMVANCERAITDRGQATLFDLESVG